MDSQILAARIRQCVVTTLVAIALAFAFVIAVGAIRAHARDAGQYENVDPRVRAWYKNLRRPSDGFPCCDISDCGPVDFDTKDDHFTALIEGRWVDIDPRVVVQTVGNPVGQAVACYNKDQFKMGSPLVVYCFVPGAGI